MKKSIKKSLESKIKVIQKLSAIDQKIGIMFRDDYIEKNLDVFAVAWDLAEEVVSIVAKEDYQKFYDRVGKRIDDKRGIGWSKEGFVPDEMMSVITHAQLSPKEVVKELVRLHSLIQEE